MIIIEVIQYLVYKKDDVADFVLKCNFRQQFSQISNTKSSVLSKFIRLLFLVKDFMGIYQSKSLMKILALLFIASAILFYTKGKVRKFTILHYKNFSTKLNYIVSLLQLNVLKLIKHFEFNVSNYLVTVKVYPDTKNMDLESDSFSQKVFKIKISGRG